MPKTETGKRTGCTVAKLDTSKNRGAASRSCGRREHDAKKEWNERKILQKSRGGKVPPDMEETTN